MEATETIQFQATPKVSGNIDGRLRRGGLRIRGHRGNRVVRAGLIRFGRWLRTQYDFPIRFPVYLLPGAHVITMDGKRASASFFAPFRRDVEPYARIATGDYETLRTQLGRDSALACFIVSLSHELIHYQQWLETGRTWESGVSRKAVGILRKYERAVFRP